MAETTLELTGDDRFLRLAVNCLIGMTTGIKFEEMFDEVVTAKKYSEREYEFTTKQIVAATAGILMELVDGNIETVRNVGEALNHLVKSEKEALS